MNNPVLLIAFPLLFSFLPTLFKKWEKASLVSVILFNIIALFFIEKGVYNIGGWEAPFGINLVLDNYSFIGVLIVNLVFALSVLISFESIGKYSIVLLISLASLNGMILTGDLFNLFVFMEIGAISAYILSSITKKYKFTFNYLVIGTLGSGLYLLGTIILYGIFGSLNTVRNISTPVYTPTNIIEISNELEEKIGIGDVVLAPFYESNVLPSYLPVKVLTGHGPESMNFEEISNYLDSFYKGEFSNNEAKEFIEKFNIRFVLIPKLLSYEKIEKQMGLYNIINHYQNHEYFLVEVHEKP